MGAGDLGVGPRVKSMARAFYGRIAAYQDGLAAGAGALDAALRRNLYGTIPSPDDTAVAAMADYLRGGVGRLVASAMDDLMAGRARFPEPPRIAPRPDPGQ
jgi:cytochrome b pre-mRNA-processing protein 3